MKKFFSVLLCVLLLISNLALLASAVEIKTPIEPIFVEALSYPEDEPVFVDKTKQPIEFYSNPFGTWLFYNALSTDAKSVYNTIVEQKAGLDTEGKITNIVIPTSVDYGLAIQAALTAVIDDYPEFFWIGGYGTGGYLSDDNYVLTVTLRLDTNSYADWDVVKDCYNRLLAAVDNFEVEGNNRYEKVKSIHDQICNMTTYNGGPMSHQPTGVFLNGVAVCEGYAEAMKMVCDRENIPCINVVGTGNGGPHQWNYVQMEDGKWYGLDATWDDQGSNIYYDYFLVGSESLTSENLYRRKFGDGTNNAETGGDHINSGTHFQNAQYALTYPTIATKSYTGVLPFFNSVASFDNSKGFMFITKDAILKEQLMKTYIRTWQDDKYIYTSDYTSRAPLDNEVTISGTTTGGTVNITSPVSRTYTVVRYGDVNKDNAVNATDCNAVRSIAMHQTASYQNKAQFAAADMNGDGVIDAFDAIALDVQVNG